MTRGSDRPGAPILENAHLRVDAEFSEIGGVSLSVQLQGDLPGDAPCAFRPDEFLGYPENTLSRHPWEVSASSGTLTMRTLWGALYVEKTITLDPDRPLLQTTFTFFNRGETLVRPALGLRMDLSDAGIDAWRVPTAAGLRTGVVPSRPERRYLRPDAPWCGWNRRDRCALWIFPEGVLDAVEVRTRPAGQGCTITPLIYFIGLSPGHEARFDSRIYFDVPCEESIREITEAQENGLRADYSKSTPDRHRQAKGLADRTAEASADALAALALAEFRSRSASLARQKGDRMELLDRLRRGELSADHLVRRLRAG